MSASEQVFEEIYTRWPIIYLYHSGSHFELISKISFPDDIGMTPVPKITHPRVTAPSPVIEAPFIRTLRSNTKDKQIGKRANSTASRTQEQIEADRAVDNRRKNNTKQHMALALASTQMNRTSHEGPIGIRAEGAILRFSNRSIEASQPCNLPPAGYHIMDNCLDYEEAEVLAKENNPDA
uniref:Reverse transcriptase domain-containing protein n=1 Tax=Rhabditophanes sp. KR3021 TaxID=114890 RepID=A0AC35UDA1_9BILA